MAVVAAAAIGGAIGWGVGGTMLAAGIGWSIGSMVGNMLFAPKTHSEGPRLEDLSVQSSTYGKPIPQVWGAMRIAGNMIWSAGLTEHKHEEDVGGKGGGGATMTTYTYTASFAIAICEGPISAIGKIWADGKLIYDGSSAAGAILSDELMANATIYHGAEDQQPDPTMEAHEGSGNVPAYRGTAYVVFEDFDLSDFGNRIPNFTFEVFRKIDMTGGSKLATLGGRHEDGAIFKCNGWYYFIQNNYGIYKSKDAVTWTYVKWWGYPVGAHCKIGDTYYIIGRTYPAQVYKSTDCENWTHYLTAPNYDKGDGYTYHREYGCAIWGHNGNLYIGGGHCRSTVGGKTVNPDDVWVDNGGGWVEVTHSAGIGARVYSVAVEFKGAIYWLGGSYNDIVAKSTDCEHWSVVTTSPAFGYRNNPGIGATDKYMMVGGGASNTNGSYWVTHDGVNWRQVYAISPIYTNGSSNAMYVLQQSESCIVAATPDGDNTDIYLVGDIPDDPKIPLSTIVADLLAESGITDYDVSALTQNVTGYCKTSVMSARNAITPLMQAFLFDMPEVDWTLRAVNRGGAAVATIPDDELGERASDEIVYRRIQEAEMPRSVSVHYSDPDFAYQQMVQTATEKTTSSKTETNINLPIAMSGTDALQAAEKLLASTWNNRMNVEFSLSPKYVWLSAGDVVTVKGKSIRIDEITYDGRLQISGALDESSAYTSSATTTSPEAPNNELPTIVWAKPVFLDLPALQNSDDDAGLYIGAYGDRSGWRWCAVYKSADDGATWSRIATLDEQLVVGTVSGVIPPATTTTWDNETTITVTLDTPDAALYSDNELNVLSGKNTAAIGVDGRWEIVSFKNATQTGADTYELSGLIRGRRGTDWATGLHEDGDTFVLLDRRAIERINTDLDFVGVSRKYKFVGAGQYLDDVDEYEFTQHGESLKPFPPAHVTTDRDASGNITISWVRRARINGEWRDYVDTALDETTELYEIDILSGSDVVRTISASSTSATYTAARQVEDFGSAQSAIDYNLYQISSRVGRGHANEQRGV